MRMTSASKIALLGGALLGAAFLLNGCVTETSGTDPIYTGNVGGSNSAGNGSFPGDDDDDNLGGSAGSSFGGSGGSSGSSGSNPGDDDYADVRFVDLIPDSSSVDICLQDANGSGIWNGPLASVTYGIGTDQFYYPTITRYVALPTGTWNIRLVDGQATSCDSPLATDQQATFQKDVGYSVVFEGYRDSFSIQSVVDRGAPKSGTTGWQAVNALTNQGSVDFGLLNGSEYVGTILDNLVPYTNGDAGDADPSTIRPAFILSSDQKTLVAYGPDLNAEVGQVHEVFLHGVNYSDTTAPATTIICENGVSVADRTALGVYADQDQHLLLDDSSCVYYKPDGTIGSSN